jgi:hypothetical protein
MRRIFYMRETTTRKNSDNKIKRKTLTTNHRAVFPKPERPFTPAM